jgi:hypothetical protein
MNNLAKLALAAAKEIRKEVTQWEASLKGVTDDVSGDVRIREQGTADDWLDRNDIYDALSHISETLANSYAQIRKDLQDTNRLSWAGTAHEIREVLSTILRMLAPDEAVTSRPWYQQDPNTSGPTQKQRVRYILQMRGAGSKERAVAEQVVDLDEMIENLVRATYSRASNAAHRFKNRDEVLRVLRYFDAFAQDLLNLQQSNRGS